MVKNFLAFLGLNTVTTLIFYFGTEYVFMEGTGGAAVSFICWFTVLVLTFLNLIVERITQKTIYKHFSIFFSKIHMKMGFVLLILAVLLLQLNSFSTLGLVYINILFYALILLFILYKSVRTNVKKLSVIGFLLVLASIIVTFSSYLTATYYSSVTLLGFLVLLNILLEICRLAFVLKITLEED